MGKEGIEESEESGGSGRSEGSEGSWLVGQWIERLISVIAGFPVQSLRDSV